ncbi:MAG: hypothetical protein ACXV74_08755 [Methylobacter sp.]
MITELSNIVTLSKNLINVLKEIKALVPNPEDRNRLDEKIESAERELALSEASMAKDLGYELCQCTFPPSNYAVHRQKTSSIPMPSLSLYSR